MWELHVASFGWCVYLSIKLIFVDLGQANQPILTQLNAARWVVQPSARPLGRLGAQARLGFWLHGLAETTRGRISGYPEKTLEDSWGKNGKNAWIQKL